MSGYGPAVAAAIVLLVAIVELLRRRRLREKYAVLWISVGLLILILAVFPGALGWVSEVLGIQLPINLLFLGSAVVLLVVSLQTSDELGQLEEETRTLAEEVGMLRLDLERLRDEPALPTLPEAGSGTDPAEGLDTGGREP